jgi:hypothetical protein
VSKAGVSLGEKLETNCELGSPPYEVGDEPDIARLQPVCHDPAERQQEESGDKRATEDERQRARGARRADDREGECGRDDPIPQ